VSLHVNGTVDASTGCTSCHGSSTRVLVTGADPQTASAPPLDAAGRTVPAPWASYGTGAHQAHLNKGTGAIGAHVMCSECHGVPAAAPTGGSDPHGNGVADFAPGPRSGTGGTSPVYGAGQPPSCSATYCHGQFTVNPNSQGRQNVTISWNAPGPLACSACHNVNGSGVPVPNDSCHPPNYSHPGGNACEKCHKNANGTNTSARITKATTHVDGVVNGKCTDCHRSETKVCQ
jgi:predicted CxxxxCH...CXXCH cytochrome family protein